MIKSYNVLIASFTAIVAGALFLIQRRNRSRRPHASRLRHRSRSPEREGRPGAVLKRDGQTLDVQIWTSLFDGDVLEVAEGVVTIETAKISARQSTHRVRPTASKANCRPRAASPRSLQSSAICFGKSPRAMLPV